LEAARGRWVQKNSLSPFEARFEQFKLEEESSVAAMRSQGIKMGTYNLVTCFGGLEQVMSSEQIIKRILQHAADLLKIGGYFFGICADSSHIWSKAQTSNKYTRKRTKIVQVTDKVEFIFHSDKFQFCGTKYTLQMEGKKEEQYLVHFPSFRKIAEEIGFKMLEITNCNAFYEDHKQNYSELLKELGVLRKNQKYKIKPEQKEIIGFYTTFVFQKVK